MSKANELRAALKAAGWSSKHVTVRAGASSLTVTIRVPDLPASVVKDVADAFHHVRHCEVSGEVLQGGNTWVSVAHAQPIVDRLAQEIVALLRAGAREWRGFSVYEDEQRGGFTVRGEWPSRTFSAWSLENIAEELAARTAGWREWQLTCRRDDGTTYDVEIWGPTAGWAIDSAKYSLDLAEEDIASVASKAAA